MRAKETMRIEEARRLQELTQKTKNSGYLYLTEEELKQLFELTEKDNYDNGYRDGHYDSWREEHEEY